MKKLIFILTSVIAVVGGTYLATSNVETETLVTIGMTAPLAAAAVAPAVSQERNTFAALKRVAAYKDRVIAPSFLRMESQISNTESVYRFRPEPQPASDHNTERKLNRNDVFHSTRWGMFLMAVVSSAFGPAVLQTYANPGVFVTAAGFTPAHLEAFYNGFIQVKVGTRVWIDGFDTARFRYVPDAQQGTTTAAIAGPVTYTLANSGFDGDKGYYNLQPNLVLKGNENTEISLSIPSFSSIQVANTNANTVNWVALIPRGFIIKDVSK